MLNPLALVLQLPFLQSWRPDKLFYIFQWICHLCKIRPSDNDHLHRVWETAWTSRDDCYLIPPKIAYSLVQQLEDIHQLWVFFEREKISTHRAFQAWEVQTPSRFILLHSKFWNGVNCVYIGIFYIPDIPGASFYQEIAVQHMDGECSSVLLVF